MKSLAAQLINQMWAYIFGIIFWPTSLKLLWCLYTDAALNFKEQQMLQTVKVQNTNPGCLARLRGEMYGSLVLIALGYLLSWNAMLTIGLLFMSISITELLLRQAARNY